MYQTKLIKHGTGLINILKSGCEYYQKQIRHFLKDIFLRIHYRL